MYNSFHSLKDLKTPKERKAAKEQLISMMVKAGICMINLDPPNTDNNYISINEEEISRLGFLFKFRSICTLFESAQGHYYSEERKWEVPLTNDLNEWWDNYIEKPTTKESETGAMLELTNLLLIINDPK